MINKVAEYSKKLITPISQFWVVISMVAMVLVVLFIVADVFMRAVFNSPIRGTSDLVILAFSMIAFFPMALAALEGHHVALDVLVTRFPRAPRYTLELIMNLITTGILGVVTWRLLLHGMRLQSMNSETVLLGIPFSPFLYLATFAFALMTLAFLIKAIESLSKVWGEH